MAFAQTDPFSTPVVDVTDGLERWLINLTTSLRLE
jgi:hypothetical protein